MLGFEQSKTIMESVLNLVREDTKYRNKGWLDSFFLNDNEPEMREHFDIGDNNDGITIIDAVQNKYCFMNIHNCDMETEISNRASDLPYLKPSTGKAFVEAYNPIKGKALKESYYGKIAFEKGQKEFKKFVRETKEVNNSLVDRLSKFKVLTESEIKKMFNKVYAQKEIA